MKSNKIIFLGLCVISFNGFSQQMAMKSHVTYVRNVSTSTKTAKPIVTESSNVKAKTEIIGFAPAGIDINYLPLFGDYLKTEVQKNEDAFFLQDCQKSFSNTKEACEFFTQMGWTYLSDGEKANAINRFNLAYLINPLNVDTFWGLGVIEYQSKNYKNAIQFMTKGLELAPTNYVLMVDLATIYLQMGEPNSIIETAQARNLLESAIAIQPNYETAYMQLTLVNLLENKNDEAWQTFHIGYKINPEAVNKDILVELLSRKPDPEGIFVNNGNNQSK